MGSFGAFHKGEKKKAKKDKGNKKVSEAPALFQMPEIISKKKKDQW